MATLKNTNISQTGSSVGRGVELPVGTTAQQTSDQISNKLRFNTDKRYVEFFNQGSWTDVRYGYGGPVTSGLVGNWDASDPNSAPTGANGNIWKNLSDHPDRMGDVDIKGIDSSYSYSTAAGPGAVYNGNSGSSSSSGMEISLTNFNKLHGSFEFWIYPTSWSSSNGLFINRDDPTPNDNNWFWVGWWSSGNRNYFRTGTSSGCCNMDLNPSSYIPSVNRWVYVCYTWDLRGSNAGQGSGYKDIWTAYDTEPPRRIANRTVNETVSASNVNSVGRFGVGHDSGNAKFLGYIGAIRHYNRKLQDDEIRQNYMVGQGKYY